MNFNGLNNPNTLWGKWVQSHRSQQLSVLVIVFMLMLALPISGLMESLQQENDITQQITDTETALSHQKQILAALQHKAENRAITPELTKQLAPINRHLQQFSQVADVQPEWQLSAQPTLKLQISSNFTDFHEFSTALLQNFGDLRLISLQIEKADAGIQSHVFLQLHQIKEK